MFLLAPPSSYVQVHRTTAAALHQLSKDPWNCVTMHQSGVHTHHQSPPSLLLGGQACDLATQVVSHLLKLIGSEDENVQEAAADCLQNIR